MSTQPAEASAVVRPHHASRRRRFRDALGPGCVAVVPARAERLRNGNAEYRYRQASDLWWLTGFPETEAVAVISTVREEDEFVLFCRPRDPERETWNGRRYGVEGAVSAFGANRAYTFDELGKELPKLLTGAETLVYRYGTDLDFDARLFAILAGMRSRARTEGHPPGLIQDPLDTLHALRLVKQPEEIAHLETAARVTCAAHLEAMRVAGGGMREYEIEARLLAHYRAAGGDAGYVPIVAGGVNATILHYRENDAVLRDGELLLIDSGCEIEGYTADVTRTFPVRGRFEGLVRDAYQLVLDAQSAALAVARPGTSIKAMHDAASLHLTTGLVQLGLLKGEPQALFEKAAQKRFYMHGTGHYLGLDVHDVGRQGTNGKPEELGPGCVFTCEPGLYFGAGMFDVPEALRGVGIRIEDDILLTADGHRNLTAAIPKGINEVEAAIHG